MSRAARLVSGADNTPLRVPKIAEVVADTIRRRIISGELSEADTLPPEGQLLEQFGVSRPTLREAFRILEAERLITVTRGSRNGAQVNLPKVESVSRYASFVLQASDVTVDDIYEARLAIEPFVVRRLAERSDPVDIAQLRAEADKLSTLAASGREIDFVVGSVQFHQALVALGGNATLHFLTRMLQDVIEQYQIDLLGRNRRDLDQGKAKRLGLKSLHKLIDLIEAGDADGAVVHWRLHVENTNRFWANGRTLREMLA